MKKILAIALTILTLLPALGQEKKKYVPLTPDKWDFQPGTAEFLDYNGKKAIKVNSGTVVLKNTAFKDGTIEYDVQPIQGHLFCFRRKNDQEQESFYLRVQRAGNKMANDGIQYAPFTNGVLMWDMYPQYQSYTPYRKGEWNHIKMVVSGKQMRLYVNNEPQPVLSIPALEGNTTEGSIGFMEASYISNVEVKLNASEGLSPEEGADLTRHETSFIRRWAYAEPALLESNAEASFYVQPQPVAFTDSITAERFGLVNLTRKFGGNIKRKVVWLKTSITTDKPVTTKLRLGISDEAWVYLNNQMVGVEKNLYTQPPMRMYPNGRISIENTTLPINLVQGENELLIAVTNDFYGWGLIAQLESTNGITQLGEISSITKTARALSSIDLDPYVGVYNNSSIPIKLKLSKKDNQLWVLVGDQTSPGALITVGNHKFQFSRPDQTPFTLEFNLSEKKMVLRQGDGVYDFVKE